MLLHEPAQPRAVFTFSTSDQLNTYDVLVSDDVVFTQAAYEAFVAATGDSQGQRNAEGGRQVSATTTRTPATSCLPPSSRKRATA